MNGLPQPDSILDWNTSHVKDPSNIWKGAIPEAKEHGYEVRGFMPPGPAGRIEVPAEPFPGARDFIFPSVDVDRERGSYIFTGKKVLYDVPKALKKSAKFVDAYRRQVGADYIAMFGLVLIPVGWWARNLW